MPIGFGLVLVGYTLVYVGVWRLRGDRRTIANIAKGVGAPQISTSPNSPGSPLVPGGSTYGSQVPKFTPYPQNGAPLRPGGSTYGSQVP